MPYCSTHKYDSYCIRCISQPTFAELVLSCKRHSQPLQQKQGQVKTTTGIQSRFS
ncbi:hypothetical protein [Escherichia phage Mt1B1_P10]|uniref:Uncharacterized protein n=1 Tax=Escherichia phage Mt1B1_P10 TaxID=2743960 RepID=A0A7H0XCA0_9CAUD|nr:hypothetical protein [Escherichia phage Mt1B1_P10]